MTEKRFENNLNKKNIKFNTLNPVWDNLEGCGLNVFEMINLLNKLNDKNEELKEYQRTLESKIVRLKDRVKTFEKQYSRKDIERYKKMEKCNCITSDRLRGYS